MRTRILTAYMFKEILFPFLLLLVILTFVLLMGRILQLMDLMINKGIGLMTIAHLILFLMPSFFTITIPVSLLIAVLTGMGRLSRDSEIAAMKSAGVGIYQLMPPVAALSIITFVITALMAVFFSPLGNSATRLLLFDIVTQKAGIGIKEKVFNDDFPGIVLYANAIPIDGKHMEGIFISDNRIASDPITIVAKRGYLVTNPESSELFLHLEEGSTHTAGPALETYKKMDFSSYDISLNLSRTHPETKHIEQKDSKEMTLQELLRGVDSPETGGRQQREYRIELHKKITLPLSCIVFGLLALPLSLVRHRTAKSWGFVLGLAIAVIYYVIQLLGQALGETGKIPPFIGMWAPLFILGPVGGYVLIAAARENTYWGLAAVKKIYRLMSQQNRG